MPKKKNNYLSVILVIGILLIFGIVFARYQSKISGAIITVDERIPCGAIDAQGNPNPYICGTGVCPESYRCIGHYASGSGELAYCSCIKNDHTNCQASLNCAAECDSSNPTSNVCIQVYDASGNFNCGCTKVENTPCADSLSCGGDCDYGSKCASIPNPDNPLGYECTCEPDPIYNHCGSLSAGMCSPGFCADSNKICDVKWISWFPPLKGCGCVPKPRDINPAQ